MIRIFHLLLCFCCFGIGLSQTTSLQNLIDLAIENNPSLSVTREAIEQQKALKKGSVDLPKTTFGWSHGQMNSIYTNDNNFSVNQAFAFPTVYSNKQKEAKKAILVAEQQNLSTEIELIHQLKSTYYHIWHLEAKKELLEKQDSLYAKFLSAAAIRVSAGESSIIDKMNMEVAYSETQLELTTTKADIQNELIHLQQLTNTDTVFTFAFEALPKREVANNGGSIENNPMLKVFEEQIQLNEQKLKTEQSKLLPEFSVGYFNQSLNGPNQDINRNPVVYNSSNRFSGFQFSVAIPLWVKPYAAKNNYAKHEILKSEASKDAYNNQLEAAYQTLLTELQKHQSVLDHYEQQALPKTEALKKQLLIALQNGAINQTQYLKSLSTALSVQKNYLESVNNYNQTIIKIESLLGLNS